MSEIQTIQAEDVSPKKKLKIEAKQKIKEIKLQAKKDIAETKYKLFLDLKKDNKKAIDKACRKIEKKRMKEIAKAEYESKPKRYSIGEEIFNSITHGIGVGLAIAGLVLLSFFKSRNSLYFVSAISFFA